MKLNYLKQHYTRDKNNNWKPKLSFNNLEELEKLTGFKPNKVTVYECSFCSKFHMTSWKT